MRSNGETHLSASSVEGNFLREKVLGLRLGFGELGAGIMQLFCCFSLFHVMRIRGILILGLYAECWLREGIHFCNVEEILYLIAGVTRVPWYFSVSVEKDRSGQTRGIITVKTFYTAIKPSTLLI